LNGALTPQEKHRFNLIETRPAKNPFTELSSCISNIAKELNLGFNNINEVKKAIKSKKAEDILNALEYLYEGEEGYLLLYVDQFEELFTLCNEENQKAFIHLLVYLLENQNSKLKIKIVFTMRRDYYNLVSEYKIFFEKTQANKYTLRRMKNEQLKECIENPLEKTFIDKESISSFSKAVLQDMGDNSSELTLLQIALTQTWKNKKKYDNDLLQTYHEIGEVSGALAKLAQDTWEILNPTEQKILKYIFIRLIQSSQTGGVTRRLADKEEFSEDAWLLAQKLSSALNEEGEISNSENAKLGRLFKIKGENENVVELTHEALVSQWPRYQRWLQDVNRRDLKRIHDHVIEKTKKYQKNKKFFLMGYELEESKKLLTERYKGYLSGDELQYIQKSLKYDRRKRRFKYFLFVGFILSIIIFGLLLQNEKDETQKILRNSHIEKGVLYRDKLNNPVKSKLLFAKSIDLAKNEVEKKSAKVFYHTVDSPIKIRQVFEHKKVVYKVVFSDDYQQLLSASADGTAKLWNVINGEEIYSFEHGGRVWDVSFSKDEKQVLTCSEDNTAKLWDIESGDLIKTFNHQGIWRCKFAKDGNHILTWDKNVTQYWSINYGDLNRTDNHQNLIWATAVSQDEKRILCEKAEDNTSILLSSRDNNITLYTFSHEHAVKRAKFSFDEDEVFTWDNKGYFKVWNVEKDELLFSKQHDEDIREIRYSPNKEKILSSGGDRDTDTGTIKLWDIHHQHGLKLKKELFHDRWVQGAIFTKNSRYILSWSNDKTVRIWDTTKDEKEALVVSLMHTDRVRGIKLSNDEKLLVTYTTNGVIRLWNLNIEPEKKDTEVSFAKPGAKMQGLLYSENRKERLIWGNTAYGLYLDNEMYDYNKTYDINGEVRGAKFHNNEKQILSWGLDASKCNYHPKNHLKKNCGQVVLWNKENEKMPPKIQHKRAALGAEIHGGEILSWSQDGVFKTTNIKTRKPFKSQIHTSKVTLQGLIISDKKQHLLTWSSDKYVRLWDRTKSKLQQSHVIIKHSSTINGAKFFNNDKDVISWGEYNNENLKEFEGIVKRWNIENNESIGEDIKFSNEVKGVLFNTEKTHVLIWHSDGTVRYYDFQKKH